MALARPDGDAQFGDSFSPDGRPVAEKIKERMPITLTINVLSMGLILLVAIPVGVYSAVRKGSLFDRISTVVVFTGFAIPTFWLALLLMILFGVKLGWLPISGISSLDYESLGTLGRSPIASGTSSSRSCWPGSGDWPGCRGTCGRTCSRSSGRTMSRPPAPRGFPRGPSSSVTRCATPSCR